MSPLTLFGASAVTVMLLSYALEHRAVGWVFVFVERAPDSDEAAWERVLSTGRQREYGVETSRVGGQDLPEGEDTRDAAEFTVA
jgi:hypothetical protein